MGIHKKSEQDLQALKDTLVQFPHIEELHFTAKGDHYLSAHKLDDKASAHHGKLYGRLKVEKVKAKVVGEKVFFKNKSVHTPDTEIVETLSSDEVLNYEFGSKKSDPEPKTKRAGGKRKDTSETEGAEGGEGGGE
ncbi:MAG: hypothetical protein ACTHMC_01540 [Pseudobacter sp.]|uniref:hypothetical protein n=1 Tax=Pseudobacter sp. TaxID=2045420 RepID=UPI003F7D5A07